jgi:hypothetical protein
MPTGLHRVFAAGPKDSSHSRLDVRGGGGKYDTRRFDFFVKEIPGMGNTSIILGRSGGLNDDSAQLLL